MAMAQEYAGVNQVKSFNGGIDNASLYETVAEAEFIEWYRELEARYPGHPLLAEIEMLMQRHIHLQRFADKVTKWSDRQTLKVIEAKQKLAEKAVTDPLTSLLNRRGMYNLLDEASNQFILEGKPYALALVDLDHFKLVNDNYGHQAGDETLVAVSVSMLNALRNGQDIVSRWGGEEFLALLHVQNVEALELVGNKLLQAIRLTTIETPLGTIRPTASIGVYLCEMAEPIESSVDKADLAMYHAKENGRNQMVRFDLLPAESLKIASMDKLSGT